MRSVLLIGMMLITELSNGQNIKKQEGPYRIGDYIVGETTVNEFKTISKIDNQENNCCIKNWNGYLSLTRSTMVDTVLHDYKVYELSFDTLNLDANEDYNLIAPIGPNSKAYLIPQLQVAEYVVNNVYLFFFYDTLSVLQYEMPKSLIDPFVEKYRKTGYNMKRKQQVSICEAAKSYYDQNTTMNIYNTEHKALTFLNLDLFFSSECKLILTLSVNIKNENLWNRYIKDKTKTLAAYQYTRRKWYEAELIKEKKRAEEKNKKVKEKI